MPDFLVLSLPRSRSRWLSSFLSYGDYFCGHDEIRHCRSLEDCIAFFTQPCVGTVETALAPFWRLIPKIVPDARVVVVRRPVAEVVASLMALQRGGLNPVVVTAVMQRLDRKLEQIEQRVPGVLSVAYADLNDEAVCARVFEHCLALPHDHAWWAAVSAVNIQINMAHLIRYYNAYAPQLEKLAKTAKHRILADMTRAPHDMDGVTFQHEPFREFYRDAKPLFAEHLVQTGQSPDDHELKNLPALEALDDAGMLQTITARSNGRMFGYLMTVVGPTLEAPDVMQGWHTIFFASPDMPGLGMKLQRASLAALRERGVDEVVMRAGHRGSGPRLGTIYRRLGAEDFGHLYRLEL